MCLIFFWGGRMQSWRGDSTALRVTLGIGILKAIFGEGWLLICLSCR